MTRTLPLVVLSLSALLALGCVAHPIQGREDPYLKNPDQLSFTENNLRRETAVGTPVVARDNFGLLFVTVPIRSARNLQLFIDYRVTFYDESRQVVGQTGWMSKVLAPNVFDQVSVNSTTPRAADFVVEFRYSR